MLNDHGVAGACVSGRWQQWARGTRAIVVVSIGESQHPRLTMLVTRTGGVKYDADVSGVSHTCLGRVAHAMVANWDGHRTHGWHVGLVSGYPGSYRYPTEPKYRAIHLVIMTASGCTNVGLANLVNTSHPSVTHRTPWSHRTWEYPNVQLHRV